MRIRVLLLLVVVVATATVGLGCEPCSVYCLRMQRSCGGAYQSVDDCFEHCAVFPVAGDPDDEGNSVECNARAAAEAGPVCRHPGLPAPGCGDPCEVYCQRVMANCTGHDALFEDEASCLAACAELPRGTERDPVVQDSLSCRIYFAGAPAAGDPARHCRHASPQGGGVCADDLE